MITWPYSSSGFSTVETITCIFWLQVFEVVSQFPFPYIKQIWACRNHTNEHFLANETVSRSWVIDGNEEMHCTMFQSKISAITLLIIRGIIHTCLPYRVWVCTGCPAGTNDSTHFCSPNYPCLIANYLIIFICNTFFGVS